MHGMQFQKHEDLVNSSCGEGEVFSCACISIFIYEPKSSRENHRSWAIIWFEVIHLFCISLCKSISFHLVFWLVLGTIFGDQYGIDFSTFLSIPIKKGLQAIHNIWDTCELNYKVYRKCFFPWGVIGSYWPPPALIIFFMMHLIFRVYCSFNVETEYIRRSSVN